MLTGKSETQTNVVPLRSASAQKNTEQKKKRNKKQTKKTFHWKIEISSFSRNNTWQVVWLLQKHDLFVQCIRKHEL